jgi:hypothetical protein
MAERAPWFSLMQRAPVPNVAAGLGMKMMRSHGASGGSIFCCPACQAERRHPSTRDRRGALGVRRDALGWRCFECDVSGDAIDLVAFRLHGKRFRELDTRARSAVAEWCREFTGTTHAIDYAPLTAAEPEPVAYPSTAEVFDLWTRCERIEGTTAEYLRNRHVDPEAVADRDLARILTTDRLPRWASLGGRSWAGTGHQLIVPCFDELGALRSVLARSATGAAPKSIGPSGFSRRGLIMADRVAQQVFQSGQRPQWFGAHELRIVVAEGEVDFLLAATSASDADEYAHASLGIFSGSFTPSIAERIPDRSVVVIATDDDEPGLRYAVAIKQRLCATGKRLRFERWNGARAA